MQEIIVQLIFLKYIPLFFLNLLTVNCNEWWYESYRKVFENEKF